MNFINNINWLMILKAFAVGGLICVVGQILIDKTKLTSARILVIFVTAGVILGAIGLYPKLINFAGAGATVPLTGFGSLLAKGAIDEVQSSGFMGAFAGGIKAAARRYYCSNFLWIYCSFVGKTKNKETIICFFIFILNF